MARLIGRKLALIVILIPLLNFLGFTYGVAHPRFTSYIGGSVRTLSRYKDQPAKTYGQYIRGVLSGDLGRVDKTPVTTVIAEPIKHSLILLAVAFLITAVVGPALGLVSISRRTRRITPLALVVSTAGLSLPGFFLGVVILGLMIYGALYSSSRGTILPMSGFGLDEHLILPVLVLASRPTFQIARITAGLLEHELQQDYVRVAQSKGLSGLALLWRHALPNVVAPVVTTIGQSTRLLMSGLIIVEVLFLWPGIGRVFMQTIGIRTDGRAPFQFFAQPELMAAIVVVFGAWLLIADLLASILACWSDPRLRNALSEQ
ncbi:MAG: ABC transporter permease [Ardenticatenaceae bacterium]|nr:ABC transporter permease [Ardenticatenaceae bacterium]